MCDCGHEHDPTEMHHVGSRALDSCAHDGSGDECSHSCDTCVLAAMRPSQARRPQPGPRRPGPVRR
jgi:hypothetical protein